MKIGVWGAGSVGAPLVWRLAADPITTELVWVNRGYDLVRQLAVDVHQGLSLAPTCRDVTAVRQEDATANFGDCDLVILTQGKAVPQGGQREDVLDNNVYMAASAGRALKGVPSVVLVVTNPVDVMTRIVWQEMDRPTDGQVIGLGTVVETARMRTAVADEMSLRPHPRDGTGFVIGTHDPKCVCMFLPTLLGTELSDAAKDTVRLSVRNAAQHVRGGPADVATVHPIVEGIMTVCRAVAGDTNEILTVSTRDPASDAEIFYSVPCLVGRHGVLNRTSPKTTDVQSEFDDCMKELTVAVQRADRADRENPPQ